MPSDFKLDISTPDRVFFSGTVESLVVTTPEGEYGFLKDHSPIVVAVSPGRTTIKTGTGTRTAILSHGFLEMKGDRAIILCDFAEWPEEVDTAKAQEERDRLQEKLTQKLSKEEYVVAQAALERAMARLKLASSLK